jgi:hypothetical protein
MLGRIAGGEHDVGGLADLEAADRVAARPHRCACRSGSPSTGENPTSTQQLELALVAKLGRTPPLAVGASVDAIERSIIQP